MLETIAGPAAEVALRASHTTYAIYLRALWATRHIADLASALARLSARLNALSKNAVVD